MTIRTHLALTFPFPWVEMAVVHFAEASIRLESAASAAATCAIVVLGDRDGLRGGTVLDALSASDIARVLGSGAAEQGDHFIALRQAVFKKVLEKVTKCVDGQAMYRFKQFADEIECRSHEFESDEVLKAAWGEFKKFADWESQDADALVAFANKAHLADADATEDSERLLFFVAALKSPVVRRILHLCERKIAKNDIDEKARPLAEKLTKGLELLEESMVLDVTDVVEVQARIVLCCLPPAPVFQYSAPYWRI
jgi:hypothetical protein